MEKWARTTAIGTACICEMRTSRTGSAVMMRMAEWVIMAARMRVRMRVVERAATFVAFTFFFVSQSVFDLDKKIYPNLATI